MLVPRDGWNPQPKIDQVHLIFIADGADLARRLRKADNDPDHIDFAPTLTDPNSFSGLLGDANIRVVAAGGLNLSYLGFCLDRPPVDDPAVRKAIAQAIDIYKYLPLGMGAAAPAIGPIPSGMHGHKPNLARLEFDLTAAKSLLKGRVIPPITILSGNPHTYSGALACAIAADLTQCGLGLNVTAQCCPTWEDMLAQVKSERGQMFIYTWNQRHSYDDDPKQFLHALFHSQGKGNYTKYKDNIVDQELNNPNPDPRLIQQKVLDHLPMVFLSHWNRMSAYRKRVVGLRLTHGALPDDKLVGVDLI